MLIWKGYGFLVPLIVLITLSITEGTVEFITKDSSFYQDNGWVIFLGMILCGIVCFVVSRICNKKPDKIYIEKDTGREIIVRNSNSFFFIEIKYWTFLLPLVGALFIFID